jgi:hypothetical protein
MDQPKEFTTSPELTNFVRDKKLEAIIKAEIESHLIKAEALQDLLDKFKKD